MHNPDLAERLRQRKTFDLYKKALPEVNRAAMTGRIGDARTEITALLEALTELPGLHEREHQAIRDALHNLRVLEREEERLAVNDKKRLLQETAQKLQIIAPRFEK